LKIVDSLPNERVAEGICDLDSDDAIAILEDLEEEEKHCPEAELGSASSSSDGDDDDDIW
jgi:Mg/Co/Ni transporter MgtE